VIGFLKDSFTSRDEIQNRRYNLGLSFSSFGPEDGEDISGIGFDLKYTFGFGLVRSPQLRFWLGPAIKFYLDVLSDDVAEYADVNIYNVGIGIGPEAGVNLHMSGKFSLGISTGFSANLFYTKWSDTDIDDSATGWDNMFYVQVAPLFNRGEDQDVWVSW